MATPTSPPCCHVTSQNASAAQQAGYYHTLQLMPRTLLQPHPTAPPELAPTAAVSARTHDAAQPLPAKLAAQAAAAASAAAAAANAAATLQFQKFDAWRAKLVQRADSAVQAVAAAVLSDPPLSLLQLSPCDAPVAAPSSCSSALLQTPPSHTPAPVTSTPSPFLSHPGLPRPGGSRLGPPAAPHRGATPAPALPHAAGSSGPAPDHPPSGPTHLIVMANGLFGSPGNWSVIAEQLREHLDPHAVLLHPSQVGAACACMCARARLRI